MLGWRHNLCAALAVYALQDNVLFFYSPSDIIAHPEKVPEGRAFRIGGLVEQGSVKRDRGLEIQFVVTDGKNAVPVKFSGVLPDLFREGQGVVAMGTRGINGVFTARECARARRSRIRRGNEGVANAKSSFLLQ